MKRTPISVSFFDSVRGKPPYILFNITSANNGPLASHSRLASQIICSQHSLLWLLRCTKTSHRDVFDCSPSRCPVALTSSNLSHQRKKDTVWCPFRWRRRRDLNSRAGYIRPTPLAGAPLRPLEYFSVKYSNEL